MKRWVIDRHGRENLRIEDVAHPTPMAGDVLVRVSAVALNARDLLMIEHGMGRATEDLVRAVDRIGLKPAIDRRYRFSELTAALERFATGPSANSSSISPHFEETTLPCSS